MKVVLQRVSRASVEVDGRQVAAIGSGLLLLVGAAQGDTPEKATELAEKTARLRIFGDENGKMNLSALDTGAEAIVVSQFTLLANTQRGRRPSFTEAAPPDEARSLVDEFARQLEKLGVPVREGCFGAHMMVELVNDGPVTILLEN